MKIIVYTHSDYSFVWKYWFGQTKKYLPDLEKIIFVNKAEPTIPEEYKVIIYDDKLTYRERVLSCLSKLNAEDTVIYHHEDMFLYDQPDLDKLKQFENLVAEGKADLIKLIRAENFLLKSNIHDNLYHNPPYLKFAIQPTIIKVSKLREIFEDTNGDTIWSFEQNSFTCDKIKNSFFVYNMESKRGQSHYDSNIYPYVATAVVKGSWNLKEYNEELTEIFKIYEANSF